MKAYVFLVALGFLGAYVAAFVVVVVIGIAFGVFNPHSSVPESFRIIGVCVALFVPPVVAMLVASTIRRRLARKGE